MEASSSRHNGVCRRAKELINMHGLADHPEGGYFIETYRSTDLVSTPNGLRSSSTAIQFLVTQDSVSRLHRIASDELWHFYEGGPMIIVELDSAAEGHARKTILGPGGVKQHCVKAGKWFGR